MLAEAMAGIATVGDNPTGYARQALQQGYGLRQLVRLAWRQPEGNGSPGAVGDHAGPSRAHGPRAFDNG